MFRRKCTSFFFCFGCLLLAVSCTPKEEYPIRLITFKGESIMPYSKLTGQAYSEGKDRFATFPTQNGDVILCGENLLLTIGDDLPDTIVLQYDDSVLYVNNKVSVIVMKDSHPSPEYLAQLSDDEIRHLYSIQFDEPLSESYKPFLKKTAQLKPDLNINIAYDSTASGYEDLRWLSQYFNPRSLYILCDTDSIHLSMLANLSNLETLILGIPSSVVKDKLPKLKSLKNLIILAEEDNIQLTADFFSENLELEKFSFLNENFETNLPPWHQLKNLRELNIPFDSMGPYPYAQHHPKLQTLSLYEIGDFSTIAMLKNLKWLALGKNVSEHDIDQLTNATPNLELLNILNSDSLKNYTALKKLPMLKYLVITEKPGLDTTLYGLKGLTYLSMPEVVFEDSVRLSSFQHALPKTIISPNSGLCMGSGWLLLLIPLTGIFIFVLPYFNKKNVINSGT